ncbi:jmjC domain-containing protein 7 [Platysternon megacephalum]|uniref:JmjC domain-containing protein 7 n=1 Tax=Platysternon megacephalum TaxID=55544 RepID=A0A4D9F6B5_9SAUR|nr:jmjC domain-containing protein 7 [Platysternon megacephalum]
MQFLYWKYLLYLTKTQAVSLCEQCSELVSIFFWKDECENSTPAFSCFPFAEDNQVRPNISQEQNRGITWLLESHISLTRMAFLRCLNLYIEGSANSGKF